MTVQAEEERRRLIAQQNLQVLQQNNLDVKQQLQQEISLIKDKRLYDVQLFDQAEQKHRVQKLPTRLCPTSITFNDNYIYAATKDGAVLQLANTLDPTGRRVEPVKKCDVYHSQCSTQKQLFFKVDPDQAVRFSNSVVQLQADSKTLVALSPIDKILVCFDQETLRPLQIITLQSSQFLLYGDQFLVATPQNDIIYATYTNKAVFCQLLGHTQQINRMVAFKNTTQCLTCSSDGTVRVFDYERQSSLIYVVGEPVESCCVMAQNTFCACGSAIWLFRREKRAPVHNLTYEQMFGSSELSFIQKLFSCMESVEGTNLLACGSFGKIALLTIQQLEAEEFVLQHVQTIELPGGFVNDIRISIDERDNRVQILYCLGDERKADRLDIVPKQDKVRQVGSITVGQVVGLIRRKRFK